jgi:hypothetical protein
MPFGANDEILAGPSGFGKDDEVLQVAQQPAQPSTPKQGGFVQGFKQGVSDLVTPITSNAQGLASDVDQAAKTGAERTVAAQNPISKALAVGGMAARIGGAAVGRTFNVAADEVGNVLNKVPGYSSLVDMANQKVQPAINAVGNAYQKMPNEAKDVVDIAANTPVAGLGLRYISNLIGKGISGAVTGMGEAAENAGKSTLISGMKPKDVTAKLAGKDVADGAKNLADNVAKYNLQSTGKGFSGISENAQSRINQEMASADKLVQDAAIKDPTKKFDVDKSFLDLADRIESGKENAVFGDEQKASDMLLNVHKSLELRGLTGEQPISNLPKIKQTINQGMQLFKKGAYNIAQDPIKAQVGELAYLKMKDDLESVVPEIAQHNDAIHDLINVKTAADQAVKRIGNRDKIGLTDWGLLLGGPEVAHTFGAHGLSALGGIPGAVLIAKKAASGGRGSSALISAGQGLQNLGGILNTDVSTPVYSRLQDISNQYRAFR